MASSSLVRDLVSNYTQWKKTPTHTHTATRTSGLHMHRHRHTYLCTYIKHMHIPHIHTIAFLIRKQADKSEREARSHTRRASIQEACALCLVSIRLPCRVFSFVQDLSLWSFIAFIQAETSRLELLGEFKIKGVFQVQCLKV